MAKCERQVSIQGLWLLSIVLLASSVVCAGTIDGQTNKEDINARSVTMATSRSASYIVGSDGGRMRGSCTKRSDGWWWCGRLRFKTEMQCEEHCTLHFVGKDQ
ncbi:hypothetical protein BDA96_07G042100 [Sorghum bicolor]|uniref:Uncharacterized protein n=2 Tax=Sorghum bicolor TaxID=4558 RepID=A0A1B6PFF6_SORBI|nr:hypothetical protein BDA96_07G042100 [Sorghum bicolor]KXG24422.1 hypothetical protein SORBI_3007G039814 [Sorghum bicolor]OQU79878.1 hypothetical protein SORBI_3007G039900 [Sorghum bicolor]